MARKKKINIEKMFPAFSNAPSTDVQGEVAMEEFVDRTPGFELVEGDEVVAIARGEVNNIIVRFDTDEAGTLLFQAIYETYLPRVQTVSEYVSTPEDALVALSEMVQHEVPEDEETSAKVEKVAKAAKVKKVKVKPSKEEGEKEEKPKRKRNRKNKKEEE